MPRHLTDDIVDELFTGVMASHGVPGGTLSVRRRDRLTTVATGVTSVVSQVPVDAQTLFRLESLSKVMTTTLVLQLSDMGLLDLDDPVDRLLGDPSGEALRGVTVRHLLSHQSGLCDLPSEAYRSLDRSLAQAAADAAASEPLFEPGANYSYSSAGFVVLGRVVEAVTGMEFGTALDRGVLSPAGLRHSCSTVESALVHRTAVGHCLDGSTGALQPVVDPLPRSFTSAGGIFSTTADLLRLASVYQHGDRQRPQSPPIIGRSSRDAATAVQCPIRSAYAPGLGQGLGWQIANWAGRRLLMQNAFGRGSSGHVTFDVDTGTGFAVLVNADVGENVCIEISRQLLAALFDVTVPEHLPSGARPADLHRYTGTYSHDIDHVYLVGLGSAQELTIATTDVYRMERAEVRSPLKQLDDERFAYGSGYVVFGGFDHAGVPQTLHVRNHLARRLSR